MKYALFLVLLCSYLITHAQETELVNLNFKRFVGETDEGEKYNTNVFEASLLFGFNIKKGSDKTVAFFRPSYHQRIIENGPTDRLYKTELIAGIVRKVNDTWGYRAFGVLRLASDYKDIDKEHYQPGGSILATYAQDNNLNIAAGIYVRDQPDNFIVFPLVGLGYKFGDDRWSLDAILPQYAQLRYDLTPNRWDVGIRLSYVTERYKSSAEFNPVDYVELTQFLTEIFSEIYITKNILAFAKYGVLNFQKYELFNSDEQVLNVGDEEVNNILSFQFGLAFRL